MTNQITPTQLPRCWGITSPLIERFWAKVDRAGDCWLWTAAITGGTGYGSLRWKGHTFNVHRLAWEIVTGEPVPDGLQVLHTCDMRRCIRNDDVGVYEVAGELLERRGHLFIGTQAHNVEDMRAKGRRAPSPFADPAKRPRGERHGNAKLTAAIVRQLRDKAASGPVTYSILGRDLGVSEDTIRCAILGISWKELP